MENILFQIITALCLVFGVLTGEIISNNIFGFFKKTYLNIIEIVVFISLLIVLFNNFYVKELNVLTVFSINFIFGLISILITRGVMSGAGLFSIKIKERYSLKSEIDEDILIIGLSRNLLNNGFTKVRIIDLLVNSGFNKRKVKKIVQKINLETTEVIGTKRNLYKSS